MGLPILKETHDAGLAIGSTCGTTSAGHEYQGSVGEGQLKEKDAQTLENQGYALVGRHSAVKVCGWTKNMIRGKGGCYKLTFYGIMSNQCMQMTTSISCANRCTFCWRGYKAPVSKEWKWGVDDPDFIIDESLKAHHKFLTGFGGSPNANPFMYKKSLEVKHVALSLTGEPITYPRMNEICDDYHKRGISTFLVTNAQYPEAIENLNLVTQLYLSIDAPNKELLYEVDRPLFKDYWERMIASLDALAKKKYRTCIRLTAIKGINMVHPELYADHILRGDADFVEIKAYMFVGESRQRLVMDNMPLHSEVVDWSKEILKYLPEYEWLAEHEPSRVVCLAKKKWNKHTWIDFPRFEELAKSGVDFDRWDYQRTDVTPEDTRYTARNETDGGC